MKNLVLRYFDKNGNCHELQRFENVNFTGVAHSVASLLSGQKRFKNVPLYLVDDENQISEVYVNSYRIRKFDHDKIDWQRSEVEIADIVKFGHPR